MKKIAIAVVCALGFTGCATYDTGGPRATSIEDVDRAVGAHQPVEYRAGYKDGCDSGYVSAGITGYAIRKDTLRYGADDLYRHGWDDGFNACSRAHLYPTRYSYYDYGWPGSYWGYYNRDRRFHRPKKHLRHPGPKHHRHETRIQPRSPRRHHHDRHLRHEKRHSHSRNHQIRHKSSGDHKHKHQLRKSNPKGKSGFKRHLRHKSRHHHKHRGFRSWKHRK